MASRLLLGLLLRATNPRLVILAGTISPMKLLTQPRVFFQSPNQHRIYFSGVTACLASAIAVLLCIGGCSSGDSKGNAGSKPSSGTSATVATEGTSAATSAGKRIILLNNTDSPFWDAARAGISKAQEELRLSDLGLTASMDSNDGTETGQIEKLRQYGTQSDKIGRAHVRTPVTQ